MDCDKAIRVSLAFGKTIDGLVKLISELTKWYEDNKQKLLSLSTPPIENKHWELRRFAFAPQKPRGLRVGKRVVPRARANLWPGMRKRQIREEVV